MNINEGTRIINFTADQAHSRITTLGFGMVLVFHERVEEATDYVAAGYPQNLSAWPFIKASKEAQGISAKKAADNIISDKSEWIIKAVQIETIRQTAITKMQENNVDIEKIVKNVEFELDKV